MANTGSRGPLTVLRAGWLFDGIGSALIPDPVVVIDGTTIRAVHSGGTIPAGAPVIDLAGATLLPGLVDTHVHLAFDASTDPVGSLARREDAEVVQAMARAGRTALLGGVTTVRDLGDRGYLSLELRGQPGLPTIVAAGPPITTPGGHCHYLGGAAAPTIEGVRAAVREHAARGVDVIKIMASGGNLTPGSRQDLAQFPAGVLRAAVDEAHRLGLGVTVNVALNLTTSDGFWSREQLVRSYAEATTLPLDHLQACLGLACLKLAVVMESIHFRHRSGQALDPLSAGLGEAAPALLELGLAVAGGQGLAGLAA